MWDRKIKWKEEKVKWVSVIIFLLNSVRKIDANNVNRKRDKGSRKTLCKDNAFEDHLGRNSLTS